jgi:hypothetical protein
MVKKSPLSLVSDRPSIGPKPPRPLGEHGLSLWNRVQSEYGIRDVGGIEMLAAACAAIERAERLRAVIDEEGEVIVVRGIPREHPALKHELAARAFVVRTLARLGLNFEAVKPVGRPGHGIGYSPDEEDDAS